MKTTLLMKRILLLAGVLVMLTAARVVFGQTAEGVITYEVKVNMHRRLPPERAEMKTMIPEYRSFKQQLFFRGNESIYKPLIEDEEEDMQANSGGMRMVFKQPNVEIYLNQPESKVLTKQEFFGKEYLIEDALKMSPWKFGTETKTIAGYECKQAFYTDTDSRGQKMEITAWYTDKLRPFLGPERYYSLPGAVLAVDINNGERIMVAKTIEARELKKNEFKIPAGGVKTTQAEFRKIMDEQMKKMGGGNGIIIRN
jgi:GLPGLI family protein